MRIAKTEESGDIDFVRLIKLLYQQKPEVQRVSVRIDASNIV
jgi:hypothetical protein